MASLLLLRYICKNYHINAKYMINIIKYVFALENVLYRIIYEIQMKKVQISFTLPYYFQMVPKNYKIHCHCFTGTYESAKKWMDMFPNLFIGLTPLVTYRTATSTHEVARFIPLERLLLETDAPYFVPRKVWCNNINVEGVSHFT
jgi:Tat protein secretion system quality control protein TatD with DNase activity